MITFIIRKIQLRRIRKMIDESKRGSSALCMVHSYDYGVWPANEYTLRAYKWLIDYYEGRTAQNPKQRLVWLIHTAHTVTEKRMELEETLAHIHVLYHWTESGAFVIYKRQADVEKR